MQTAIVYASNQGTTEKVALKIQESIGEDKVQRFFLKKNSKFELSHFEQVIPGGSIYAAQIQKHPKDYYQNCKVG
ncbi:MAG: flavodoxin family protein [Bacteroidota bacterium]